MPVKSTTVDVACYGELLWDMLPGGALPGGAPMNVAYHVKKLGCSSALITRTGNDIAGDELRMVLQQHGLPAMYVQKDGQYPTGLVTAIPQPGGDMHYDIKTGVAWDQIEAGPAEALLVAGASCFVFGSLAARYAKSRQSLMMLLEAAQYKVLDINLRAPHYDQAIIAELLHKADMVKMNEQELALVAGWFANYNHTTDQLLSLKDKFSITELLVTRGAHGAWLVTQGNLYTHPGIAVTVADTIGSGDAFLAAMLCQQLKGTLPAAALEFASAVGAFIATKNGGCPQYNPEEIPFPPATTSMGNPHTIML